MFTLLDNDDKMLSATIMESVILRSFSMYYVKSTPKYLQGL